MFFPQKSGIGTYTILQLPALILISHILLFSRIALVDVQVFMTLVAETAKVKGVPEAEIWDVIMNQWWNRVRRHHTYAHNQASSRLADGSITPSLTICRNHGTGS